MTNAEKLAKDTNLMLELFQRFNCGSFHDHCWEVCQLYKKFGIFACSRDVTKEWLESEVEEDDKC